ncbi:MAG: hypothetical protein J6S00_06070 [Clostridia bacterium]|nr:hypothetical protein [Clostridia bacterium]
MAERNNVTEIMEFVAERTINLAKNNSVLGEPFQKDGMTIVPVSKLSVSFAGGGADIVDNSHKKRNQPTGGGAKVDMVPMSFLVIKENEVKVVNVEVKEKSNVEQIIEIIVGTAKQLFNKKAEDK